LEEWRNLHGGLLFKVVRSYTFNSYDQDDLFQEITRQLRNSVPRYRGDSAVAMRQKKNGVARGQRRFMQFKRMY